jgi:hypothetical protein
LFLVVQPALAKTEAVPRPLILIYSQNGQGYGEELGRIIESDGRMDAQILVVSEADLFRGMLYFPYVKVAVAIFNHDRNEGLSEDLENYYAEGGGIVGLGFAGWWTTTRNASRNVFSLAANLYVTGRYDRDLGTFTHSLQMVSEHEINSDIGSFTAHTQRVIMRRNTSTGEILEPEPTESISVLYRETSQNAPVVVLREENGICVTFGGFSGDDIAGVPTYYGHLTTQEAFRQLFTNAVHYVWENERRYDETVGRATQWFAAESRELDEIRSEADRTQSRGENLRLARHVLAFMLASLFSAVAYRYFFRKPHTGGRRE